MELATANFINRSGGDVLMFFQTAYQWCFGKHSDVITKDASLYKLNHTIPAYVRKYVCFLEGASREDALKK